MIAFTIDDGRDPIDGSEINAVRRLALELIARGEDDLTDMELMLRQPDDLWFADFCLTELRRLPSEVQIGMREYCALQARGVVKQAQDRLARTWAETGRGARA